MSTPRNNLADLIRFDLYRHSGKTTFKELVKNIYLNPGYEFMFLFRITQSLKGKWFKYSPFSILLLMVLLRVGNKYGIQISHRTRIGKGFLISHFGSIVVNGAVIIGSNCNISHDVTLGVANRGTKKGNPTIGDGVYIGPGAKIFGNIKIGNNVAIGANCVVTKDVPDNAVVVGIPAKIISYNGSSDYIINKV